LACAAIAAIVVAAKPSRRNSRGSLDHRSAGLPRLLGPAGSHSGASD